MFITHPQVRALARLVFSVYLIIGAAQDIRTRSVSARYLTAGGGLAVFLTVILSAGVAGLPPADGPGTGLCGRAAGAAAGLICVLISRIRPGSIGAADGILIAMIGMMDGCYSAAGTVLISLGLAAVFGIVCGLIRRCGIRGMSLPFIPFLAAGYAAGGVIWPG